jgi:transcription elongation GreA/GreB family factor
MSAVFVVNVQSRCMNKNLLLKHIVAALGESLEVLERAARASHVEATHESSRDESKYDTRGLEAAYLAGGQARQAREIIDSMKLYQSLATRDFAPGELIDLTAVVKLETDGAPAMFFIGPKSGGVEVNFEGEEITVITPQSPLGQNLVGKKAGQGWSAKVGGATVKYRIVKVW